MKRTVKIKFNSPVVLAYALASLAVVLLNKVSAGRANVLLFSVYRSSLADVLTYPRFILHILGSDSFAAYVSSITVVLIAGPAVEERRGSRPLLGAMLFTALISGLIQWLLFPGSSLTGAGGIIIMILILLSFSGGSNGSIPATLLMIFALYIAQGVISGFSFGGAYARIAEIAGGVLGALCARCIKK